MTQREPLLAQLAIQATLTHKVCLTVVFLPSALIKGSLAVAFKNASLVNGCPDDPISWLHGFCTGIYAV